MSEPDEQLVFILSQDTKWGNYTIHPARAVDQGEFFLYLGRLTETDNCTPATGYVPSSFMRKRWGT